MMKKILALALACLFMLSAAACAADGGSSDTGSASSSAAPPSTASSTSLPAGDDGTWTGEVSKIIVTYLSVVPTPPDLLDVQAAVNEISVPKVGVEIEFLPVNAYDAMSQFPLWVGGGDQIDLMMLLLQDVKQYVAQGLIDPLDELVANNAPAIAAALETFPLADGTYVDGRFYGLTPIGNAYGNSGGFPILKKYVDEVGFEFDPNKIYTLDDLAALLTSIKEKHPDMYPNASTPMGSPDVLYAAAGGFIDLLGGTTASGVLMDKDSTTIENLFATPQYEAYARTMREWQLAGLSHPDAATTATTNQEMVISGVGAGYFVSGHPLQAQDIGAEEVCLIQLSEPFVVALGSVGSFWTVPFTSANPDAAMRFLNLMYEDHALSNLLQWGIEGRHYVVADESIGLIAFPEGVDANSSGYYNTLGLYGDRRYEYVWSVNTSPEILAAYSERALANGSRGMGYAYDNAAKIDQIAAIQAIIAEYANSLAMGSVDVDTVLPEFIAKLESAGINDVIADNQAQFDAWLATQ